MRQLQLVSAGHNNIWYLRQFFVTSWKSGRKGSKEEERKEKEKKIVALCHLPCKIINQMTFRFKVFE
jgi:hypothetical protein